MMLRIMVAVGVLALFGSRAEAQTQAPKRAGHHSLRGQMKQALIHARGVHRKRGLFGWWHQRQAVKRYRRAVQNLCLFNGATPKDPTTRTLWKGLWDASDHLARHVGLPHHSQVFATRGSARIMIKALRGSRLKKSP